LIDLGRRLHQRANPQRIRPGLFAQLRQRQHDALGFGNGQRADFELGGIERLGQLRHRCLVGKHGVSETGDRCGFAVHQPCIARRLAHCNRPDIG
jgi:hypothetical protein